jgi:hypothetical protein
MLARSSAAAATTVEKPSARRVGDLEGPMSTRESPAPGRRWSQGAQIAIERLKAFATELQDKGRRRLRC